MHPQLAAETSPKLLQHPTSGLLSTSLLGLSAFAVLALAPDLAAAAVSRAEGPERTLAYLDPGTGSFVIQAVVAGLAGVAVTLRLYWGKIKAMFGAAPPEAESAADDD